MGVEFGLILIGGFAIFAFIIYGFWEGRQNREPLIRDEKVEENAAALTPTAEIGKDVVGRVSIVDNDFANEITDIIENNERGDKMYINTDNESPKKEEELEQQPKPVAKKGFWSKIKDFFKEETPEEPTKHEPSVTDLEIPDPEQNYQIRLKCEGDDLYAAKDIIEVCKKYQLTLGKNDIFYFNKDNREVFRLCGGSKPYGFGSDVADTTVYKSLILIMVLPDRGFAEKNYLFMAQCAFRFQQALGGIMRDGYNRPLDQTNVTAIRNVLANYDRMP